MGTANFHNKNASKVYAVEIDDEFELACAFDSISSALKSNEWDTYKNINKAPYHKENHRIDRNFPGREIGTKAVGKFYGDAEIFISVTAIMRSGYYAGVNFDYTYQVSMDRLDLVQNGYGEWVYRGTKEYDLKRILRTDYGMNAGLAKIQGSYAEHYIERMIEEITLELEGIYESFSTPLTVKARFSNGETMYQKA